MRSALVVALALSLPVVAAAQNPTPPPGQGAPGGPPPQMTPEQMAARNDSLVKDRTMHVNEVPFINGGQHIEWAPEIPTYISLGVIIGTIIVAVIASLVSSKATQSKLDARLEEDSRKSLTDAE